MSRMHADEVDTDVALVERLLAEQFPQWAGLPIERVESSGTVNAIYRLGADMAVRLPRIPWGLGDAEREHRWLPWLAPQLPLAVPTPLAKGEPGEGYPWPWSIVRWLDGGNATPDTLADLGDAARALAWFVTTLRALDPAGAPGDVRGGRLTRRDADTRKAIAALGDSIDGSAATAAWDDALAAPPWDGHGVWCHGDLHSGNLLASDGRMSGVIDFGEAGAGDPATDTIAAWWLFTGESREIFRTGVGADDATWARGRGWALSQGLIGLPYYVDTNPVFAAMCRRAIDEALDDVS